MTDRANLAKSKSEFTRAYENLRGVDFSEISTGGSRFAHLENMYVDYDGGADAVESIPGFRKIFGYGERINAIHLQELGENGKFIIVHSGTKLYRFDAEQRDALTEQLPIATLEDTVSHSFSDGDFLYVMDGKSIIRIDKHGTSRLISDEGDDPPYVPTTYENAEKKEDRNLLTDRFIQEFTISGITKYLYSTKRLCFAINDHINRTCSVTGMPSDYSGDLYIPAIATIDGIEYKVTEVAPSAFLGHEGITAVYGGANLEYIGKYAFKNCPCLEYAVFQDSLRYIDYSAFCNSSAFSEIYIGLGFEEFATDAVINCNLRYINYSGDEHDAEKIKGIEQFEEASIFTFSVDKSVRFGFPILGDVESVDEVIVNSEKIPYNYRKEYAELDIALDRTDAIGSKVTIKGTLKAGELSKGAILGCTLSTAHDGRVFLSGNPKLPGYVFYSLEKPGGRLFFSEHDCFTDGVNNYPITSLMSANGTLTVFKSDDDGSGSIFCHTAESKNGKRSYPLTYTHGGISNRSASYVIDDDAVFLSEKGLFGLEKAAGGGYKELRCRSSTINRRLLAEDLSAANMTEWCGYLVLCTGEHFYLADTRNKYKNSDSFEYEWYYLSGIGTYSKGERVYRYSPLPDGDFLAMESMSDEVAEGTVISVGKNDGSISYYVEDGGKKYSVYPTDEFIGGTFSPASFALGVGELLFFGTECGDLCVFNNDKRGVAPNYISESEDFSAEEYANIMGNKIHPFFYDFDGRSVKYSLKCASDDCGVPHLAKSTAKHSLVIKCKNYAESSFSIEAVSDHGTPSPLGKYSTVSFSFGDINFGGLDFTAATYSIIPISECEKGWLEKQLSFHSESFRTPFGICSFTYRYKIKGNIKYL